MYSMRVIFRALHEIHLHVLHDCKKHMSNTSCVARESVFLCAAHKLTAIVYQRRIKAYNEMARYQSMIRHSFSVADRHEVNIVGKCKQAHV